MEHQVLDFRHAMAAIGRRWWVLLTSLLLGLGVGGGVLALSGPTYRARARVLLPPSTVDAKGNDLRDAKSEAYLIDSPQILDPAGQSLKPPMSAQALRTRIHVRSISSQIEEVVADAASPADAARFANAVASAYVAFNDSASSGAANLATSVLSGEATGLNQQIQTLDARIAADTETLHGLAPADAQRETSVIDSLRSQEASLAEQLVTIQGRIADAQLSTQLNRQGTQLLQPATAPKRPVRPRPLLLIGGGSSAGLIVGAVAALALGQGDRRLRLRDEIAFAAGAPVLASLAVPVPGREQGSRDLLESWEPSIVDNLALRRAFLHLDLAGGWPANLVVVTLPGDPTAPLLSMQLAIYAARAAPTAYIFGAHHSSNTALRAACVTAEQSGTTLSHGLAVFGAGGEEPVNLDAFDLTITSIVAGTGPVIVPTWNRRTVISLALSCGVATGDLLEEAAAACLDAGMPLSGVFLANPDAGDRTTGRNPPAPLDIEPRTGGRRDTLALNVGADPTNRGGAAGGDAARAQLAAAAFASLKAARQTATEDQAGFDVDSPTAMVSNGNGDVDHVGVGVDGLDGSPQPPPVANRAPTRPTTTGKPPRGRSPRIRRRARRQ